MPFRVCRTLSDQKTLCIFADTQCQVGEWECDDGQCVIGAPCDQTSDCVDQSDEAVSRCCELGQFVDGTQCEDCPIGTYQYSLGQTSCITCLQARYTDTIKSVSETDCKGMLSTIVVVSVRM